MASDFDFTPTLQVDGNFSSYVDGAFGVLEGNGKTNYHLPNPCVFKIQIPAGNNGRLTSTEKIVDLSGSFVRFHFYKSRKHETENGVELCRNRDQYLIRFGNGSLYVHIFKGKTYCRYVASTMPIATFVEI